MPDDSSAQNQGVEYRAGFGRSVNNDCLKNQQLTPFLSLSLFQQTELWFVPDDNYAQKQGMAYQTGLHAIITVSTVRNLNLSEV